MEILAAFIQLFVITDPLGNLPIFHSFTSGKSKDERQRVYLAAGMFAFVILLVFALLGVSILNLLNISLSDFRIAGGLLLLIIAIIILVRGSWISAKPDDGMMGAVPLGCPLLAGPGAITTAMVLIGTYGYQVVIPAIVLNFIISIMILFEGEAILRILGETGAEIVARIMAIFLAAIGVHNIIVGISQTFLITIR